MLNGIIRFSIRNKLIIGLITAAWILWGIIEMIRLPVDALPDITSNQVQIITVSPTLASMEVERLITFPIEQASANIPGIKEIRSISRFGLSVVTVVFDDSRDVYWCRQQVSERMSTIKDIIPKDAGSPEMAPVTTGLGEIYQYVVKAKAGYEKKYDLTELRTIQDWIIRRQLLGTPGVADISSFGGKLKQYEVAIDPTKMRSTGISLQDVFMSLEKNNHNSGAAYIEKGPSLLFIRTEGIAKDLHDIENIFIKSSASGTPIYVRDVATVQIGSPIRYGALTFKDQGEVSGAVILMLKGQNASDVIKGIKAKMDQIRTTLPEGVEVEVFLDRTKMVDRTLSTVKKNLFEGALIVILILVFFLGNLRAGFIVASVIPLSMLFAVGMMNLFGISGNLMSLGALDFGLIVDGAVIIVEAVLFRLHSHKQDGLLLSQFQMDTVVEQSAGRMMGAAVFGQLIILIVYIPIFSLTGIEGKMFKPMAQTVAFALIGAFILSLTYIPMMTSILLSKQLNQHDTFTDRMIKKWQNSYRSILEILLLHPKKVILSSVLLFVISLFVASGLGGEFIPELEEGDFAIDARMMTGTTLSETINATTKAAHELQKFPEVEKVVTRIGASEIPTDPMPIEMTDIIVNLKPKNEWTSADSYDELANKMSAAMGKVPGLTGGFQYPVQMRFNELIAGAKQDVVCKVFGEDLDTLVKYANEFATIIGGVDGAKDVFVERITGLPQIVIRYNKPAIAAYQLNIHDINKLIRAAFAGEEAGVIYENERRFGLVVRLSNEYRNDLSDLKSLMIVNSQGIPIPLSQVAEINIEEGPNQIQREDAKRRITVAFNVRGRDVQSIVQEVQQKANKAVKLPAGYFVKYGGQFENLVEAKQRLVIAVPIALLLILLILYFSFGSLKYGLLIFSAIPLSAIGGIILLWIRGMPFSISAGVGFIALFGVAVLNGIVLISEFNRLKNETTMDMREVVLAGTSARLRPVLMTAAVASLGFLPMALSTSSGAEVQRPLATVVIGGLISATLLTLLVLPVLYVWFEKRKSAASKVHMPLILIGLVFSLSTVAQNKVSLSLDSVIKLAEKNELGLKIAGKQVDYFSTLKSIKAELPQSTIGLEYGNINSAFNDTRFFFNQSFQLPKVYIRQQNYQLTSYNFASAEREYKRAELNRHIRKLYFKLQDLDRKSIILNELSDYFQEWKRISMLQAELGELQVSAMNLIKVQTAQTEMQLLELNREVENIQFELKGLLQIDYSISPTSDSAVVSPMNQVLKTTNLQHPLIQIADALVLQKKAMTEVERNKLSPMINLGYSNLSIKGWQTSDGISQKYYSPQDRFGIYQLNIGIPIISGAIRSRIKASKINEEVALIEKELQISRLNTDLQKLNTSYNQMMKSKSYYEAEGLKIATDNMDQATLRLKAGDIPFSEWLLLINQSVQIKASYLEIVHQLNLLTADYIYLTENR
jgi:cobalt-zinc-cadmium resistance protein CzcA